VCVWVDSLRCGCVGVGVVGRFVKVCVGVCECVGERERETRSSICAAIFKVCCRCV